MPGPWVLLLFAQEGAQIASRGVLRNSTVANNLTSTDKTHYEVEPVTGGLGLFLHWFPVVVIFLGLGGYYLMNYVLFDLVFTLASVEAPVPGGPGFEKYGLLDSVDDDDEAFSKKSDDNIVAPSRGRSSSRYNSQFVSSSIRSLLRHVGSEAGDLSMFRGLGANLCVQLLASVFSEAVRPLLRYPFKFIKSELPKNIILGIIINTFVAQASTAWVHIIISKPRHKFWFRRLPLTFFSTIKFLLPVILTMGVADPLADFFPTLSFLNPPSPSYPVQGTSKPGNSFSFIISAPSISVFSFLTSRQVLTSIIRYFLGPALWILLAMPVDAACRRMQASLLPDEDDPIIPIDRTFSNAPSPAISSGILAPTPEPLGFRDSIKSVVAHKPTLARLARLTVKLYLVREIIIWVFLGVVFLQLAALFGFNSFWVLLKLSFDMPVVKDDLKGLSPLCRASIEALVRSVNGIAASATVKSAIASSSSSSSSNVTETVTALTEAATVSMTTGL